MYKENNRVAVLDMRIERTAAALRENNMDVYVAECTADVPALVRQLCPAGASVACGGSVSLSECGVDELLRSGEYNFIDRDGNGDAEQAMRAAFSCDCYFTSSNAVTESGELYNVDGRSNRTAAMLCGPRSVIVVCGVNKIVRDLDAARERVRATAAPMNAVRLNKITPCARRGYCSDCRSPERICCNFVIMSYQRTAGRIKVILVREELGY